MIDLAVVGGGAAVIAAARAVRERGLSCVIARAWQSGRDAVVQLFGAVA